MSTFFDNEDEDDDSLPALPPPLATHYPSDPNTASSSRLHDRQSSVGSRSFLSRLETAPSDERGLPFSDLNVEEEGEGEGEDEEEMEMADVKRMTRVWVRERATVEIISWQGDLMDSLFDKLEQQVGETSLDDSSSVSVSFFIASSRVLCDFTVLPSGCTASIRVSHSV